MAPARTPLGAGLRSLILPGWGQLGTRFRRLGWALVAATILTVGMAGWGMVAWGPMELTARLADPEVLLMVLVLNGLVAATRLSTEHAW